MTPEEFQQAEDLFHQLSELGDDAQRARLRALAAAQPELAQRLGKMLSISDFTLPTISRGLELQVELQRPARLPPYELERLLGMGGMGEVWSAQQTEPLRRRVAIKFVRSGLDRSTVLERFRSERQALALMDHPSIAKVFDAGADDQGRPYFVMELVNGEPITEACDRERLPIGERLRLLCEVCDAVQHAHRRGVIHRDLKPSNILVRKEEGGLKPTVIDFGIAKAVDPTAPLLSCASQLTELGQPMGTLDTMSPEQASGIGVDTRTDVYALGVLLYQLLVGTTPFRDPGETLPRTEIQRRIAEEDPPRLRYALQRRSADVERLARQRCCSPSELARLLRGELEWIVERALEKDPERRYDSPAALGDDLQRYLSDRPLAAGPAALDYRARKFLQRHRGAALSAAAILLTTALGAVGAGIGWSRSLQAERLAVAEAAEADATRDFLLSLFEVADPEIDSPRNLTAPDLLARGAERLNTELIGQPDLEAALSQTIGRLYVKLGLYAEATQHLERAVVLREAVSDRPELGAALLELARHRMDTGDYEAAAAIYSRAEAELALAGGDAASENRVRALTELSSAHRMLNQFELGLERSQQASDLATKALTPDSPIHVPVMSNHAALLWARGDLEGAGDNWSRAIEHARRYLGPDHYFLGSLHQNLGTLRRSQDRYEESIRLLREAESSEAQRYGDEHPFLANLRASLAESLIAVGDLQEAERLLGSSLAIVENSGGAGLEYVLQQQGRLRQAQGRFDESLPILHAALRHARSVFGELHQDTAYSWLAIAITLRHLGDFDEAERYAHQALDIIQQVYVEPNLMLATYRFELVELALSRGDLALATERMAAVDSLLLEVGPAPLATRLAAEILRARLLSQQARHQEAHTSIESVLSRARALGTRHPVRRDAQAVAARLVARGAPEA